MGTQFRVKGDPLEQTNGSYLVHLAEMDNNNDEPMAAAMSNMHVTPKPSTKGASGK